jgi:tellurite resistance protein TerC
MTYLRKFIVGILGGGLLAVGVAMILLPGPAIVVIPIALAILALEFACARRWQTQFRERIKSIVGRKTN